MILGTQNLVVLDDILQLGDALVSLKNLNRRRLKRFQILTPSLTSQNEDSIK